MGYFSKLIIAVAFAINTTWADNLERQKSGLARLIIALNLAAKGRPSKSDNVKLILAKAKELKKAYLQAQKPKKAQDLQERIIAPLEKIVEVAWRFTHCHSEPIGQALFRGLTFGDCDVDSSYQVVGDALVGLKEKLDQVLVHMEKKTIPGTFDPSLTALRDKIYQHQREAIIGNALSVSSQLVTPIGKLGSAPNEKDIIKAIGEMSSRGYDPKFDEGLVARVKKLPPYRGNRSSLYNAKFHQLYMDTAKSIDGYLALKERHHSIQNKAKDIDNYLQILQREDPPSSTVRPIEIPSIANHRSLDLPPNPLAQLHQNRLAILNQAPIVTAPKKSLSLAPVGVSKRQAVSSNKRHFLHHSLWRYLRDNPDIPSIEVKGIDLSVSANSSPAIVDASTLLAPLWENALTYNEKSKSWEAPAPLATQMAAQELDRQLQIQWKKRFGDKGENAISYQQVEKGLREALANTTVDGTPLAKISLPMKIASASHLQSMRNALRPNLIFQGKGINFSNRDLQDKSSLDTMKEMWSSLQNYLFYSRRLMDSIDKWYHNQFAEDFIANSLYYNPSLIARVVADSPQMVGILCNIMVKKGIQIKTDRQAQEQMDQVVFIGSTVAALGLALASAGFSLAGYGGLALSTSGLALGAGVTSGAYNLNRYHDLNYQYNLASNHLISLGEGNPAEVERLLAKAEKHFFNGVATLTLAPFELGIMYKNLASAKNLNQLRWMAQAKDNTIQFVKTSTANYLKEVGEQGLKRVAIRVRPPQEIQTLTTSLGPATNQWRQNPFRRLLEVIPRAKQRGQKFLYQAQNKFSLPSANYALTRPSYTALTTPLWDDIAEKFNQFFIGLEDQKDRDNLLIWADTNYLASHLTDEDLSEQELLKKASKLREAYDAHDDYWKAFHQGVPLLAIANSLNSDPEAVQFLANNQLFIDGQEAAIDYDKPHSHLALAILMASDRKTAELFHQLIYYLQGEFRNDPSFKTQSDKRIDYQTAEDLAMLTNARIYSLTHAKTWFDKPAPGVSQNASPFEKHAFDSLMELYRRDPDSREFFHYLVHLRDTNKFSKNPEENQQRFLYFLMEDIDLLFTTFEFALLEEKIQAKKLYFDGEKFSDRTLTIADLRAESKNEIEQLLSPR